MPFAVGMRVSPCEDDILRVATGSSLPVAVLFFDLPKRKDMLSTMRSHAYVNTVARAMNESTQKTI